MACDLEFDYRGLVTVFGVFSNPLRKNSIVSSHSARMTPSQSNFSLFIFSTKCQQRSSLRYVASYGDLETNVKYSGHIFFQLECCLYSNIVTTGHFVQLPKLNYKKMHSSNQLLSHGTFLEPKHKCITNNRTYSPYTKIYSLTN